MQMRILSTTEVKTREFRCEPLTRETFSAYGDVIEAQPDHQTTTANQGTAKRSNYLTRLVNLRLGDDNDGIKKLNTTYIPAKGELLHRSVPQGPAARCNVCVFNCVPPQTVTWIPNKTNSLSNSNASQQSFTFDCKLLERHMFSSQLFSPLGCDNNSQYLVVVCLNDGGIRDAPDLSTLRIFVAGSHQAINYHAGVWHHPIVTLQGVMQFLCIVHERNEFQSTSSEDTDEILLKPSVMCFGTATSPNNTSEQRITRHAAL